MAEIQTAPKFEVVDDLAPKFEVVDSPDETAKGQADADITKVARPSSAAPAAPARATLDLGKLPQSRSIAEGLETEQEERRGGMPFSWHPATGGLGIPQPAGITPVAKPTQKLAAPAAAKVDVREPKFPTPVLGSGVEGAPSTFLPADETATAEREATAANVGAREMEAGKGEGLVQASGVRGYPQIASGLKKLIPPSTQPNPSRKDVITGTTDLLRGSATAATPLAIASGVGAPLETAAVLAGGSIGKYGAGKLADLVGTSPETKGLLEEVGGLVGGIGAGVGANRGAAALRSMADPEDALTDVLYKRGQIQDVNGESVFIRSPEEARAVAKEMLRQNPPNWRAGYQARKGMEATAAGMPEPTPEDIGQRHATAAQTYYDRAQAAGQAHDWMDDQTGRPQPPALPPGPVNAAAQQILDYEIAHGQRPAPPPPPAPAPPPPPPKEITADDVATIGKQISGLPADKRAPAILQAHQDLSQELLQAGKFVGPDGKLQIVENEKQASKLAQTIINDEIDRAQEATKKAAAEPPPVPKPAEPVGTTGTTGQRKSRRAQAADLAKPKFEVVDSEDGATVPVSLEQNGAKGASLPSAGSGEAEQLRGGVSERRASGGNESQRSEEAPTPKFEVTDEAPATAASSTPPDWFVKKHTEASAALSRAQDRLETTEKYGTPDQVREAKRKVEEADRATGGTGIATVAWQTPDIRERLTREWGEPTSHRSLQTTTSSESQPATAKETPVVAQEAKEPEKAPVAAPEAKPAFEKDSPVSFTRNYQLAKGGGKSEIIRAGTKAFVEHAHPNMNVVRVRLEDGRKLSVNPRYLEAGKAEKPAEEKPTKYKFGNTQAPIPANSEAAAALKTARDRISDSDLAGKGKETDPHVTVRYGIKGEDTSEIKKFLSQQAPFEAMLGKTESFPPSDHSDGAAVIQSPIEAPELHRLNAELEKHGEFTEPSFAEYKPHATIAYVDPEKSAHYVGMKATEGKKFTVDKIYITDRNGNAEAVKLEGKAHEGKAAEAESPLEKGPVSAEVAKAENQTAGVPATEKPAEPPTKVEVKPAEHFTKQVEADKEGHVERYLQANTDKTGLVSISADRARHLFPEYAASKEGAFLNTEATNHAASVIASAAFDKALNNGAVAGGKEAVFIAGMPGAGKSSAENAFVTDKPEVGLFYEGNLSDPALLQRRVQAVLDAGGKPTVVYVYAPPKAALERMIGRAGKIGRYVPIEYGAKVAAATPGSIEKLYEKFGDQVKYGAVDNSGKDAVTTKGIDSIRKLAENRTAEEITDEQHTHAKALRKSGTLSDELYERIRTSGARGEDRQDIKGNGGEHQKASAGPLEKSPTETSPTDEKLRASDWERANAYEPPDGSPLHVRPVPASFWTPEKRVYSLMHADGTRGGTATKDWDEIVARADKENLRMGEAEKQRLAYIESQKPQPGSKEYEALRSKVAEKEAQSNPSDDQKAFIQGANAEVERVGKEANDYGKVLAGVAKVLESKDIEPRPDKYPPEKMGGSFYSELSDLFHNPLASFSAKVPLSEIVRVMEGSLPDKPVEVDPHRWFDGFKSKPSKSMKEDLNEEGAFGRELTKASNAAEAMHRKADIVFALKGGSEFVDAAWKASNDTLNKVAQLREAADDHIRGREQEEVEHEQRLAEAPKKLAEAAKPIDQLRWTPKQAWGGNVVMQGEKTPWISDGHSAINADFAVKKFTNKNMAGESRLSKFQTNAGARAISAKVVDQVVKEVSKKSTNPADVVGYIPAEPFNEITGGGSKDLMDRAYLEDKKTNKVVAVNGKILRMIQDVVQPDSIKVGPKGDAVTFYKGKEVAAVLMPLKQQGDVDLPTFKKAVAGEFPPPTESKEEGPALVPPGPGAQNLFSTAADNETGTTNLTDLTGSLERVTSPESTIAERMRVGARLAETAASAGDHVTHALERAKGAAAAMWDALRRPPEWEGYQELTRRWTGAQQFSNWESEKFADAIKKAVPESIRREAITNWIEADGDEAVLRKRADLAKFLYKRGYDAALALTEEEKTIARNIMNYHDGILEEAKKAGIVDEGVENYVQHIWEKEPEAARKVLAQLNFNSLRVNPSFSKKRVLPTYFDGEKLGFRPVNKDIGFLVTAHNKAFEEAIAARTYIKSLFSGKASDGRPLATISRASAVEVSDENAGNDAYLVRPNLRPSEQYADYERFDHPALRKWRWAHTEEETGKQTFVQGDALLHPEVYDKVKNNLSRSAIRSWTVKAMGAEIRPGQALLRVSGGIKHVILSLSGFHEMTERERAAEHGVFRTEPLDLNDPEQRFAVDHGLMVADYNALQDFSEGVAAGGLASKIPAIGPAYDSYLVHLFRRLIPELKMAVFKKEMSRNADRYPDLTRDQAGMLTADQVNETFGGLNYKAMGRNPTMQDIFRLAFLAPDFFESSFKSQAKAAGTAAGGAYPYGRGHLRAILVGAVALYALARILNEVTDGQAHWDKPFSIVYRGKEYSIRTRAADLLRMVSEPQRFMYGRLSPLAKGAAEAGTGYDDQGHKIDVSGTVKEGAGDVYAGAKEAGEGAYKMNWDQVREGIADVAHGAGKMTGQNVPIPLQSFTSDRGDQTTAEKALESMLKLVGVSVKKFHSPTEEEIYKINSEQPHPSMSEDERKKYYARLNAIKGLRSGNSEALNKGISDGLITPKDLSRILRESMHTEIQGRVEHMSFDQVRKVYDVAVKSKDEAAQREIAPILLERQMRSFEPIDNPE